MSQPISVRKTLARLVYAVEKLNEGENLPSILSSLEFTEDEFSYMCNEALRISNLNDYDLEVFLNDGLHKSDAGGAYLAVDSVLTAWI